MKEKSKFGIVIMAMIIITGLSLCFYPVISNLISERVSSRAIEQYDDKVSELPDGASGDELRKAEAYNLALFQSSIGAEPTSVSASDYEFMLNPSGDGMMGYVEIPAIDCRLPIYHGTDAETLESYIGHMPSSSLPVGGKNTHCVLTGHTGMPSAKLLTGLDAVAEGDIFTVTVLGRKLSYEVDRVLVVKPDETDALRIENGQDYCTLVTCTPYGINTHRLLVRGHRVSDAPTETEPEVYDFTSFLRSPVMIALAIMLVLLLMIYAITHNKRNEAKKR